MSDDLSYQREPETDDEATAEEQSVVIRAELAASGWTVDVPQPTPDDIKDHALKADEAEDEES
ncbi:hypothetical protein [Streptomyces sp. SP18BB07]|uniref:hypothetical protein n=1 Tax=Streptomyces sp. SP18BB07 TaxID=3002522 RepID=UPI002E784648|nr:hypothetical protein [Streptomyces sp. SP18BB07]MEE1763668.1 hypothetical protein [Streptomyces sp. SP18BB07]